MGIEPDTPLEAIPTPPELKPLFKPLAFGPYTLSTRVVYAPLTRNRAEFDGIQPDFAAQYYSERGQKGQFMLTEAVEVSKSGHGYPNLPGIYTQEQMDSWKPIVQKVKEQGTIFFCQLWHCGRASHSVYHDGELPVAPSACPVSDGSKVFHPKTFEELDFETPRALTLEEIPKYVEFFRQSAANAIACGFNGVEIHAGNGYLIDEFLKDSCNKRTDEYGGSIENRCRFLFDVVEAVTKEVGADRVGVRLTPYNSFLDSYDSSPVKLFNYVVAECAKRGVLYVHMIEARIKGNTDAECSEKEVLDSFVDAAHANGTLFVAAGGFTKETAAARVASGKADLIAMGRWALANPDLLKRFKLRAPLNKYDRPTFYTPGKKGYIDYPFLQDTPEGATYFAEI